MRRQIDLASDHTGALQAFVDPGPLDRAATSDAADQLPRSARSSQTCFSQTWRSGYGRLFHFHAVQLLACRAPARAAYVLVRRDEAGHAVGLFVGAAVSRAPTLNLARIRERAANLGATEVHLLDLTHAPGTYAARRLVRGLRAGLRHATV